MLVMTTRVDMKKIAIILAAAAALIVGLILLLGGNDSPDAAETAAGTVTDRKSTRLNSSHVF